MITRRTLLAAAPLAAVPLVPAAAQQSLDPGVVLIHGNYTVTSADNGKLLLVHVNVTPGQTHGSVITFEPAAQLVADGPFSVTIKKADNESHQVVLRSQTMETIDLLYKHRRLVQAQDSVVIAAYVDEQGFGRLVTTGGSYNAGAMRGHRSITAGACHNDAHNVSAHDIGILHRLFPPGDLGGPISLYLPPLYQVTGENPDGSPSYLSKTFWFQMCNTDPRGSYIIPTEGNRINSMGRIHLRTPYAGLIVQAAGDQWWAQATNGAGATV